MNGPRPGGQLSVRVAGAGSVVSGKIVKSSVVCLLAAGAVLAGAGCDQPGTTTQPTPTPTVVVQPFTGTLVKGGSAFFSFTVPQTGTVSLTLLSLTIAGAPTDATISMGVGAPGGTTCRTNSTTNVTPGATPQVTATNLAPGIYCALVTDPGNLTADANFSINITRPQ
jgi:hypothetical protein